MDFKKIIICALSTTLILGTAVSAEAKKKKSEIKTLVHKTIKVNSKETKSFVLGAGKRQLRATALYGQGDLKIKKVKPFAPDPTVARVHPIYKKTTSGSTEKTNFKSNATYQGAQQSYYAVWKGNTPSLSKKKSKVEFYIKTR